VYSQWLNGRMMSFRAYKHQLYPYSVPATVSFVNLTLNTLYKNDKNIKFVVTRFVFSSSKCIKIIIGPAGGTYDTPPDPLVGWEGGYPFPIPHPLDAFGVSNPRFSGPPQHKFLATPVPMLHFYRATLCVARSL